jgi:uncharacterized protein
LSGHTYADNVFNCSNPTSNLEQLICSDPTLANLNGVNNDAYAKSISLDLQTSSDISKDLYFNLRKCNDEKQCLASAYVEAINSYKAVIVANTKPTVEQFDAPKVSNEAAADNTPKESSNFLAQLTGTPALIALGAIIALVALIYFIKTKSSGSAGSSLVANTSGSRGIISSDDAKKYFDYPSKVKLMWYSILAVVIPTYMAVGMGITQAWLGVLVLIAAAIIIYTTSVKGVCSDQDIEDAYENFAIRTEDKAIAALNVSKGDLIRQTDWFWSVSGGIQGHEKRYRDGDDGVNRANTRSFLLVMYGEHQIMSYEVDYNIEADAASKSNNSEWFYKDVVGVEVGPDDRSNADGGGEMFILRSSGGAKYFPMKKSGNNDQADGDKAQVVMNSIRAMLREKKR